MPFEFVAEALPEIVGGGEAAAGAGAFGTAGAGSIAGDFAAGAGGVIDTAGAGFGFPGTGSIAGDFAAGSGGVVDAGGGNAFYPMGGAPSNVYESGGTAPQYPGSYGAPPSGFTGPPLSAANPMAQMQQLMKGVGSMPWNSAGGAFNVGSGAYGMYQAQQMQQLMKQLQQQGDPFAQYRSGYGAQLQQLMQDPSSITSTPGYQFNLDQGTQALMRSQAAGGTLGSGQGAMALQKYGQDYASGGFQQQLQNLMGLSGANVNPGQNANLQFMGNMANLNLQGNALNRIGYGSNQLGYGGGA